MFLPRLNSGVFATALFIFATYASAEKINAMPQVKFLNYNEAFRYAAAWASFNNVDVKTLSRTAHEFHGALGSLDFEYSEKDQVLHIWVFVTPGAGPLLTDRTEMKTTIDQVAQQHPEETAGAVFDIRTLDWNKQASPKLEPCLYLRLDLVDSATPVDQMMEKFRNLSRTGYIWHRQKMLELLQAYWKEHPKTEK